MTDEEIRAALGDRVLMRITEETGISHNTLVRFRKGYHKPRKSTLDKLREYLAR